MSEIEFPIPEGMVPPDGVKEGATFDALATLELGKDYLKLVAVDGLPVKGMSDKEDKIEDTSEPMDEEGDFQTAVKRGMDKMGMMEG